MQILHLNAHYSEEHKSRNHEQNIFHFTNGTMPKTRQKKQQNICVENKHAQLVFHH